MSGMSDLKEKVDRDPDEYWLWGYFNPETGKTSPHSARIRNTPGPQFESSDLSKDGVNAVATHAVRMKYEDFFAGVS